MEEIQADSWRPTDRGEADHYVANYAKTPYNPMPRFGDRRNRSPSRGREDTSMLPAKGRVVMNEATGIFEIEDQAATEPVKFNNARELQLLFMGESPVTFKAWLDYQDPLIDEEIAAKSYGQYKERYEYSQLLRFFQDNYTTAWFKDLYDPEVAPILNLELKGRIVTNLANFMTALEDGKYDSFTLEEPPEDIPKPEKMEVDGDAPADMEDGEQVDMSEEQRLRANIEKAGIYIPPPLPHLLIKNASSIVSLPEIQAIFAEDPMLEYVATSDPNPSKRCSRVAWAVFKPDANFTELYEKYKDAKVGETTLAVADPATLTSSFRVKATPDIASLDQRLRVDLAAVKELITHFETEYDVSTGIIPRLCLDDAPEDLVIKSLDLGIITLRRIFLYCYYCGAKTSCEEDLYRKCSIVHWRRARDSPKRGTDTPAYSVTWARGVENRTKMVLSGTNNRILRHFNHASVEELQLKGLRTCIKQEDTNKYRCIYDNCNKLFKGEEYVVKHVRSKHAGCYPTPDSKTLSWSAYISDPFRISYASISTMRNGTPLNNHIRRSSTAMTWGHNDSNAGGRDRRSNRMSDRIDRGDRNQRDDRRHDPYGRPQRRERPDLNDSGRAQRAHTDGPYVDLDTPSAPKDDPFGTASFELSYE